MFGQWQHLTSRSKRDTFHLFSGVFQHARRGARKTNIEMKKKKKYRDYGEYLEDAWEETLKELENKNNYESK